MTTTDCFELPIVDFAPFSTSSSSSSSSSTSTLTHAQRATAQAIDAANRKHGFVCLRNSGISKDVLANAFDASQKLFATDHDIKTTKFKPLDPTTNTGYSGYENGEALNRRRRADLKECFNIRQLSATNGDYKHTPDGFETAAETFWKDMNGLGKRYATCCAVALGLESDYFSRTLKKLDLCTLRMLHYPPVAELEEEKQKTKKEEEKVTTKKNGCSGSGGIENNDTSCTKYDENDPTAAIRVGEHTDFGAFTFLFVKDFHDESSHGLQVKGVEGGDLGKGLVTNHDDTATKIETNGEKKTTIVAAGLSSDGWKDVVFDSATIASMENDDTCPAIVNTGALMARWTNDEWKATAHRVIVKPQALHSDRYSIALFFDPDKETICSVHPKFLDGNAPPKYPPISSLEYLLMKLREVQGEDDEEKDDDDK